MSKCGSCGRFLSSTDGAKCSQCSVLFHRRCVALPPAGPVGSCWTCPVCTKKRPAGNSLNTPPLEASVPSTSTEYESPLSDMLENSSSNRIILETTRELNNDINSELRNLRDNLRKINSELHSLREEIVDVRASLKDQQVKIASLESRLNVLESQGIGASGDYHNVIENMKRDLNLRDQELLANDVEIVNLPETNGENPMHVVMQVAVKLGLKVEERDIVSVQRVGGRHIVATGASGPETRTRPLVVRLTRRDLRDDWLKSARVRQGATTADLGLSGTPRRFYVNERMSKYNRQLFRQARDAGQRKGWKFVWFKHGRILARAKQGDEACLIRSEADIRQVFGFETVN